jgi:hypothetical protein
MSPRFLHSAWLKPALRSATLVFMLLVAEAFTVVHPLDVDAHATDEPCKICISVASFGAADVANAGLLLVDGEAPAPFTTCVAELAFAERASYSARAPPYAS